MRGLDVVEGAGGDEVVPRLVARCRETGRVALAAWRDAVPGTLLGRFHAGPADDRRRRRRTGGRVVETGPEHVRLALALPHRSALESEDPSSALRPEQAMNRCVRGVLDAYRNLGVDALYPGRDVVTVARLPVAWLSFTEEEDGTALFEAGLAAGPAAPDAVRRAVDEAYRRRPWLDVEDIDAASLPVADARQPTWSVPIDARRTAAVPTMLGSVHAYVRIDEAHRIASIRLAGDVIAPVATVQSIEAALVGVPALRGEIERAVATALAEPRRWVLGIDGPRDVAAAVLEALR